VDLVKEKKRKKINHLLCNRIQNVKKKKERVLYVPVAGQLVPTTTTTTEVAS
jgi:hypothetical protein